MTYLRGTTCRNQTATRHLDLWTEPVPGPAAADWIAGFVRAARQVVSPFALREFVRELYIKDPLLSFLGVALMAVIPVFAAFAFLAPHLAPAVNPWIKPIKFSLSFSTFAATISLFLLALRIPEWQLKLSRRAIAGSVA